ncbi:hypothetical protein [Vulcanisaeta sp. JCM 16159]
MIDKTKGLMRETTGQIKYGAFVSKWALDGRLITWPLISLEMRS